MNRRISFEIDTEGINARIIPHLLHFKQPAGTSRGTYTTRKVWYLLLFSETNPQQWGIGECAPLPALSCDDRPDYEKILKTLCHRIQSSETLHAEDFRPYPSILFGLETAWLHYRKKSFSLFDTAFSRGESGIPINGLIWMGSHEQMLKQIETKIEAGFQCIKLKIGAIDFEQELSLLHHIRRHFSSKEITLRVDANGAFSPSEAAEKLQRLAEYDIHSIEQPIRSGLWDEMAQIVAGSPIPVALDEELIGHPHEEEKRRLLSYIHPAYIILKPSLHGGINGGNEWISEAERLNIGWWITSALESNIGLNAIAQWCATFHTTLPQGLGTGSLFTDNIPMPLSIRQDQLEYQPTTDRFPVFSDFCFPDQTYL